MNEFCDESTADDDGFDSDAEYENIEEPISKLGDIWLLGNHRLMCGDSCNADDVAKLMGGEKADMAFTDPPWNVNYGAVEKDNPQGYKPRTILNDYMSANDFKNFMMKAFNN